MFPIVSNISSQVVDQARNEEESASFTCQATGEPVPIISWYFNSALLANGTKYTVLEASINSNPVTVSSTLTIVSVKSSDVGTYTCNATNVASTDTSFGVLTVNGEIYVILVKSLVSYHFYCSCPYHYCTNGRTTV